MLKPLGNCLLTIATAMTPLLLSACGDDGEGTSTKFADARVQVVSTPAATAQSNYQALILGE